MNCHHPRRRFLLRTLPAAAGLLSHPLSLLAQSAATSPTLPATGRILVGYPPGGSVDITARKLAEQLTGRIARQVLVDNKPGAAGRLAVEALKTAAADGATWLITPGSVMNMYPHIYKGLAYDVFHDLLPVSVVANTGFALAVGPMVPASVRHVDEFIAWCKANPLFAQCGNPGAGSLPHFMALLLARDGKLDMTHVPFRGGSAAMQAVAAGQVSAALSTESSALALAQAGKLRVLASAGPDRSAFFPQVPTFREQGYANLVQREWFGAFVPAKTPAGAVQALADALRTALREPEVQDIWRKAGLTAESSTPLELQQALRREHDFWGPIIRASGFTPEA